jgi:hypothetical protein
MARTRLAEQKESCNEADDDSQSNKRPDSAAVRCALARQRWIRRAHRRDEPTSPEAKYLRKSEEKYLRKSEEENKRLRDTFERMAQVTASLAT